MVDDMVEGEGGGTAFLVVFFDGEREMSIGKVRVNPTLEYKPFQHMLSQKIGISPNQISIYLADRRNSHNRRIPITGKANFASICRQKDCCFLVVLKRSRKTRNRKEKAISAVGLLPGSYFPTPAMQFAPVLLQRNPEFNDRLQGLGVESENYEMAMARGNLRASYFLDLGPNYDDCYAFHPITDARKVYCEECVNAGKNGPFHPCANDAVVTWFTTPMGPICRPNSLTP